MTVRKAQIDLLLAQLLAVRNATESLRILCVDDAENGWEKQHEQVKQCVATVQNSAEMTALLFPEHKVTLMPFLASLGYALSAAEDMFTRYEFMSQARSGDLKDHGHYRAIQKHMGGCRRVVGALAREAREAAHIAQFIINRIDGVRDAKPA